MGHRNYVLRAWGYPEDCSCRRFLSARMDERTRTFFFLFPFLPPLFPYCIRLCIPLQEWTTLWVGSAVGKK